MLKELVNRVAVSGMEDGVRDFLKDELKTSCQTVITDGMGNLHAINQGDGGKLVLITYMDEPGVIVTRITEDGYLQFETVGRINPAFLVSKRVFFGAITGVISLKAIHLTTKKEREIPVKASQLFIDIGASSKEEAEKLVDIGEYGTLDIPYLELRNGLVKGRAIAGRMGCKVAVNLLKKNPNRNIHAIFAVQREIKNRGILGYGFVDDAEYTIVLDGIKAKDYLADHKNCPEIGKGVIIASNLPGGQFTTEDKNCRTIAEKMHIPYQLGVLESQVHWLGYHSKSSQKQGVRRLSLAIPVGYPDSVAPVAKLSDMEAMEQLAQCFIDSMSKEEE